MVVTIFKVATSLSIFSTTQQFLAQQRKQMKGSSGPATPRGRGGRGEAGGPCTPPPFPSTFLHSKKEKRETKEKMKEFQSRNY